MEKIFKDSELADIFCKVQDGTRLNFDDGMKLYNSYDINRLGFMANAIREKKNKNVAYYIINRHINYTNICKNRCKFCAFSKDDGEKGAYVMSIDEILKQAALVLKDKSTELHIVGGLHPDYKFDYYLEMISKLHNLFPDVHLQAFTAVEIAHLADIAGMSVLDTLTELKNAGLGSLPGGGAEVFATRLRDKLCPEKLSGDGWINVMREAHGAGLRSNATMLYGHIETGDEVINHLLALRNLQDETKGFMSFIPLSFHPKNTELDHLSKTTGFHDLKMLAIGRLMLDNFDHIKAFWIMLGTKLAQVSLSFGADDIDGTVSEEKITHAAGADTPESLTVSELVKLIKEAGREPVERNTLYEIQNRN
ncbi:MAG: aminofutalosine synthase MqnE [Candidatus Anammoxibacter sp.]